MEEEGVSVEFTLPKPVNFSNSAICQKKDNVKGFSDDYNQSVQSLKKIKGLYSGSSNGEEHKATPQGLLLSEDGNGPSDPFYSTPRSNKIIEFRELQ